MRATQIFAAVGLASVGAVGVALVSQHVYGMQPCPWCVLQRVIFLGIAIVSVVGLVWRHAVGRLTAGGLGLVLALCGVSSALWQHFQAASSASCNLTLADRIVSGWLGLDSIWPEVFSARASCADAAVNLFGVPYDLWSLALFTLLAFSMLRLLRSRVSAA